MEELREWNSKKGVSEEDGVNEGAKKTDKLAIHKQILDILRPGETILKVCTPVHSVMQNVCLVAVNNVC